MYGNLNHPNAAAGPGPSSLNWSLRLEDAVVETVVTHTTRTTTSFPPIVLPRIRPPQDIPIPDHLDGEIYPLAKEPCPADMQIFSLNLGGQRVLVQDDSVPVIEGSKSWSRRISTTTTSTSTTTTPKIGGGTSSEITTLPKIGVTEALNRTGLKRPLSDINAGSPNRHQLDSRANTIASSSVPGFSTPPEADSSTSPPRKRVRGLGIDPSRPDGSSLSLLSPRPSPPPENGGPSLGSGLETAALFSHPTIVSQFDNLPDKLQQHVLMHLFRRSRMPTIQRLSAFVSSALRRDFISCLPHEVAVQVLQYMDAPTLAVAMRVSKKWRKMIDGERSIWHRRIVEDGLQIGLGCEEEEEALIQRRMEILSWKNNASIGTPSEDGESRMNWEGDGSGAGSENCVALKHVYRRRRTHERNWKLPPLQYSFQGFFNPIPNHPNHVVTCTQFDSDKIISASDDNTVNIYDLRTGQRRKRLDGHTGGVWAMEYYGDILVTGSTDRMVRVWDLETYETTHIFAGHTSTIRCLQIVKPVLENGKYYPPYPLIVTGSRDRTIRVWRLPRKGDVISQINQHMFLQTEGIDPESNPYHLMALTGHTDAVRAVAAHGRICVSASYDATIRVWDLAKGKCLHVMKGHEGRVYSVVYDRFRQRCASGSADNTVRVWDVKAGTCLQVLTGHTSLVGLLDMSPNYMVSAAADASLRVWDTNTLDYKLTLSTPGNSITCFAHDEHKVVSGSDGSLRLWDIKTGGHIRDLITGVQSVWQVVFRDNMLVAATNRGGAMQFEVFDFGKVNHISGVDDESLDDLRRPPWEIQEEEHTDDPSGYNNHQDEGVGSALDDEENLTPRIQYRPAPKTLPPVDPWILQSSSPGSAIGSSRRSGRLATKAKSSHNLAQEASGSGSRSRRSTRTIESPNARTRGGSQVPSVRARTRSAGRSRGQGTGTSFAPIFNEGDDDLERMEHEEQDEEEELELELDGEGEGHDGADDILLIG